MLVNDKMILWRLFPISIKIVEMSVLQIVLTVPDLRIQDCQLSAQGLVRVEKEWGESSDAVCCRAGSITRTKRQDPQFLHC
jgi:hypothetical protein